MKPKLILFLAKKQAVEGTPEVSLVGADLAYCYSESKIEYSPSKTELDLIGAGYTQVNCVIGREECPAEFIFPLRNMGDGVTPEIDAFITSAGFDLTEVAPFYVYTPSNTNRQDCTVWKYGGNLNTGKSVLEKCSNLKFDWKLSFDFTSEWVAKISFTGKGRYTSMPTDDTQPSTTPNATFHPSTKGSVLTLNGNTDYRLINLDIEGGQPITSSILYSDPTGVGISGIDEKKFKFTAKVYKDIVATTDPHTAIQSRSEGLLDFAWGTGPLCQITANYSQLTAISNSSEGGFETYDLEGQLNRNDFVLKIRGVV